MPNICSFELGIKGKKENCKKLVDWLQADYGYDREENFSCSSEHHFYRVFECNVTEESTIGEDYFIHCVGNCAWSVWSCMFNGNGTYYQSNQELEETKDNCAITITDACKELNLVVAIESEECGINFSERYLIRCDGMYEDECVEFREEERDDEWIGQTEDGMTVDIKYSVEEETIKLMPQEL